MRGGVPALASTIVRVAAVFSMTDNSNPPGKPPKGGASLEEARLRQQARDEPVWLVEQGQQEMFAVDLRVPEAQRLGLRVVQGLLGLLREPVRIHAIHLMLCFAAGTGEG